MFRAGRIARPWRRADEHAGIAPGAVDGPPLVHCDKAGHRIRSSRNDEVLESAIMAEVSVSRLKDARPLSPHLQIYTPMLTMMMSIIHRITGGALYFGMLLVAWWLIA